MKTSNGVAAVFSLDFQINAAIILMLINIEKANKVKVERETGRVDITFSDNKLLIAQVKAVVNPHDFSQVKEKLEKGLQSLNQAAKFSDVEQLVYITNSPNPFNEGKYRFINAVNMCPFSELPLNCQQIIIDICQSQNYDLDQTLLTIGVIQFFGQNEDERYKVMFSRIEEFLKNIEANSISIKELLTIWQNSFRQKASQKELTITKNDMIWPIIASVCKINEEAARLIDYDNQDIDEIIDKYRKVINNKSEKFDFRSFVLSDYKEFNHKMTSKESIKSFTKVCWQNYKKYFDLKSADKATEEAVIKLTIANILRSRSTIANIKVKVNL